MRKLVLFLVALAAGVWSYTQTRVDSASQVTAPTQTTSTAPSPSSAATSANQARQNSRVDTERDDSEKIRRAFDDQQGNIQVHVRAKVEKVLRDDRDGSRHQRFIVRLANGQTVLVAHNIDLADRVADLRENEGIELFGEYEWNNKGGVIHWTHRDPAGRHTGGWIKYDGRTYQ